jgi:DNA topoisomerase IB
LAFPTLPEGVNERGTSPPFARPLPGISRTRHGKGFSYRWSNGRLVRDAATRDRIRGLAIPPAWEEVWISADERRHLQAAGTDAAGRRQYLYHHDWRARRDSLKFSRVEMFARSLPALRDRVERDIRGEGLTRERVLACAARLLDEASVRNGGEAYAEAKARSDSRRSGDPT